MMYLSMFQSEIERIVTSGLPSDYIRKYARTLAVRNPHGDLSIIKHRLPWFTTAQLNETGFITISEGRAWDAAWSDLIGKDVIVDPVILNEKSRKEFENFFEMKE